MLTVVLFLGGGLAQAQTKLIRLRNETIATTPVDRRKAIRQTGAETPASGLYLIQLEGQIQPAWRGELRQLGVELVRYVPDDTFIVRLNAARIQTLQELGFVRWVGAYRPEHKIQEKLIGTLSGRGTNDTPLVRVLLAPGANATDILAAATTLGQPRLQPGNRFGRVLEGQLAPGKMAALASSAAVLCIESARKPRLYDEVASKIVGGDSFANLTFVQELGYDGTGVAVAVADTGLHSGTAAGMHPDLLGRVNAFFFYGGLLNAADEHSHGTHVAGIIAGNGATGETDENGALYGLGVAPKARIVVQRIFDGLGNYMLDQPFSTLTGDAVLAGAVIGSNSWGDDTQGQYDISAAEFDALVRDAVPDDILTGDQPYILEFSAGNAGPGPQTVGSPAVAKNVIATGASQNNRIDFFIYAEGQDAMADFSSRGPCADGRIKPDVVAPGTWISSLRSVFADDNNAWGEISPNYMYQGGTSQAGPHVSGAAAVFVQYYRELFNGQTPSPAMVKAALINSATDMDDASGTEPAPNNDEGWGRVDLVTLIASDLDYDFADQTELLSASRPQYERHVVVSSGLAPLVVTMAYTDVPGVPTAAKALVNDLDLEVIAPDGRVYRGNNFEVGETVPDAGGADTVNNVEGVRIRQPIPGDYLVRVRAASVVEDARRDTAEVDQDFALVVSGYLVLPGASALFLDRSRYSVPGPIQVRLVDYDQAGKATLPVAITSTTEPAGMSVVLRADGSFGMFTGAVYTATGPATADALLQIAHNDTIQVSYSDVSQGVVLTAVALADLLPPNLVGVSVANSQGKTLVSWQTDEPASSIVHYGTNMAALNQAVTNRTLTRTHSVALPDLRPGSLYYYWVASLDEAGNAGTNNNGGSFYTFVAVRPPTVLLVDAYVWDGEATSTVIPVGSYTSPIVQAGYSYSIWDKSTLGSPRVEDLKPFPVVIWRINDSFWTEFNVPTAATISGSEQRAITNYLAGGGSFLMASMEILTRPGIGTFKTDAFKVQSSVTDFGVPSAVGADGSPFTSTFAALLNYTNPPVVYPMLDLYIETYGPDFSDLITPLPDAFPILLHGETNAPVGVAYPRVGVDSPGRTVFLSFPIDTVPMNGSAPDSRVTLFRDLLRFLAPGANGQGQVILDREAYTYRSQVIVEVADSDLAGQKSAPVSFASGAEPAGQVVTLWETSRRGLFRGTITVVAATNAPAAGELRVAPTDTITASYFDASAGAWVSASATVDITPPAIANVSVVSDYVEATVRWTTDELTDGTVVYGESQLLGRSAYVGDLTEVHEVLLTGLLPDKEYYFKVVSRDLAGNALEDDNQGHLYTFRTLRPVIPPWFDNMENAGTNWTVLDADGTETSWRLGAPGGGASAHSPTRAWGSNLDGGAISYSESFLVSPAIALVGGNQATLTFWHDYDLSTFEGEIIQFAEFQILTNNSAAPLTLASYDSQSFGWTQEQIDLTPYLGSVVYLIWHYGMLSISPEPRLGWLVDDVSVSVTTLTAGSITVTNNLSQARFTVRGPVTRSGAGLHFLDTNMPPGDYTITFNSVSHYHTPGTQSATLSSGGNIQFAGYYSMVDVNGNGIPDSWEQQFFGAVTNVSSSTDTDGDGMSDFAEFMAGTNPTNAASTLKLTLPLLLESGLVRVDWPSVPGRAYRLDHSTSLVEWINLLDWTRATNTQSFYLLPASASASNNVFRLQVRP